MARNYVQPQVLRTYVLELRKLLGDSVESPRFIRTVPGRGYWFLAQVEDDGGYAARRTVLGRNLGRDLDRNLGAS